MKNLGAVTATCTHTRVQSGRPQMEKVGPEKIMMEKERRPSSYINTSHEIRRRNNNLLMNFVVMSNWPSGLAVVSKAFWLTTHSFDISIWLPHMSQSLMSIRSHFFPTKGSECFDFISWSQLHSPQSLISRKVYEANNKTGKKTSPSRWGGVLVLVLVGPLETVT